MMPDPQKTDIPAGKVEVRVISGFEIETGEAFEPNEFVMVDETVAKEWVEDGLAERKTSAEWKAEEEERQAVEARKARRRKREQDKQSFIRVREDVDVKTGGWKNFGLFCKDVARASGDNPYLTESLKRWDAHCKTDAVEYDDSQGGYLVPPQYMAQVMRNALENSIVSPRATHIPMETNRIAINAVVDNDHSSNLFGGITLYRPGEVESKTASKPTFRQIELTAHKLIGLVTVSDELLADSPVSVGALMTELFSAALAWQMDEDFINGTGVNQPLGVVPAACTVTQAAEAGQGAATIVFENIIKMWSRLYPPCQGKAVWLANHECAPQLYSMNLAVGVGGSAVFLPAGGVSQSPYATLMGRPLIFTEKCQALGTAGDIILADFSQYLVAEKNGGRPDVNTSIHLYFNYDKTAFRYVLRYDGQPWWNSALTPANGTATLSPFVILNSTRT